MDFPHDLDDYVLFRGEVGTRDIAALPDSPQAGNLIPAWFQQVDASKIPESGLTDSEQVLAAIAGKSAAADLAAHLPAAIAEMDAARQAGDWFRYALDLTVLAMANDYATLGAEAPLN